MKYLHAFVFWADDLNHRSFRWNWICDLNDFCITGEWPR